MKSLRFVGLKRIFLRRGFTLFLFGLLVVITGHAQCDVNAGNDVTICAGQSVTLGGNPVMNNPPNDVSYNWSANTGSDPSDVEHPSVSPTVNTVYTLDVDGSGCNGNGNNNGVDQVTVTVIPANFGITATANGSSADISICAGQSLNFNSSLSNVAGQQGNATYSWTGPNGFSSSIGDPLIINNIGTNAGGVYTVTTTIGNCVRTDNILVTVNQAPNPEIVLDPDEPSATVVVLNGITTFSYCEGSNSYTFPFIDASTSQPGATFSVAWGNSSGTQTYGSSGWIDSETFNLGATQINYTVTNPNGCATTESFGIYIGSNPAIGMSNPGNTVNLCTGDLVCIPIDSVGASNNPPGTSYYIDFGDGTDTTYIHPTPAQICHRFLQDNCTNPPNYQVQIEALNACSPYNPTTGVFFPSTGSAGPFIVSTNPTANFIISPQDTVCVGTAVTISNTSSASQAPQCSTPKLAWKVLPSTGWTASGNLGNTNNNFNSTTGWANNAAQNPVFNFNTPGTYCITLYTGNNLCGIDSITQCICVESPPSVAFTATPLQGCAPLNVDVNNTSISNSCAVTRLWTSTQTTPGCPPQPGAPTITSVTSLDPNVVFEEPGVYNLNLTMTNTCGTFSSQPVSITVNSKPIVAIGSLPTLCAGQACISPTSTIQNCGSPIISYSWTFSGGLPSSSSLQLPGQVCYSNSGSYTISASASNICGTTTNTANMVVSSTPVVDIASINSICSGSSVNLDASVNSGTAPYTYLWSPNTNLSATNTQDVVASPASNLNYTLQVTDAAGCSGSDIVNVVVDSAPTVTVPDFSACTGNTVDISAAVANAASGLWTQSPLTSGTFGSNTSANTTFALNANTTGNVILTWTTEDPTGPCGSAFDTGTLTITPPPSASFTTSFVGCSNESIPISVNSNVSGTWTSSNGLGTFIPDDLPNSTYIPALSDTSILVNLTWTTIDPNGPCNQVIANTTLDVFPSATANAGGPYQTCGTAAVSLQALANRPGSWSVTPTSLGTFADPDSPSTTFTPTSSNGQNITLTWTTNDPDGVVGPCDPVTSNATLQVFAPPTLTLNLPASICSSSSIPLSATSSVATGEWTTTGGGTILNDSAINTTYTPVTSDISSPPTFTWLTDDPAGPCGPISSSATVSISEVSTANAGGDYITCGSNAVDISATGGAGTWLLVSGSGSFAENTSAATTFIPAAGSTGAIEIAYQVDDPDGNLGPCTAVSDNAFIQIYAPPSASFSSTTACEGIAINLQATSSTNTGLWTSSAGGTFSINPPNTPNINYTPPLNVSSVNLTWTTLDPDGDTGPCVAVSSSATLTVNSQIEGTVEPLPYVTCGIAPVNVQVNSSTSGTWSVAPGLGNFNPFNSNSTIFTPLSGSNQSINLIWTSDDPVGPCPALELDTIIQVFGPATAEITSALTVCDNEELQLTVASNTTTGVWSTLEGTGSIDDATENSTIYTPSETDYLQSPIEFFFIIPDPDGIGPCDGVSDSIEVEVNLAPTADAGADETICSGGDLPLLTGTPTGGEWSGAANSSGQFIDSGIGSFESYYTYIDIEGCEDVDTVVVNVFPTATASAGGPYPICGAQPIVLNAGTNGTGQWTGGQGEYSLDTDTSATYTPDASEIGFLVPITWTTNDPDGLNGPCTAASATAIVAISEPAAFEATTPITICSSDTADLSVNTSPATGTWSGGTGTFLDANSPTTFYVPTIDDVGDIILTWETTDPDDVGPDSIGPCTSVEVEQIVFVLDAATADAGEDIYSCGLDIIQLHASANGNGEWSGGLGEFSDLSDTLSTYLPDSSEVGQSFELYWTTFDPDLTVISNGPCTGDIDTVVIQINVPAFAEIDDIDPICSNGDATLSVTSYPAQGTWDGGAGQYAADNQLSTTYTPAASETAIVIPITWTTIDPDGTGPSGPCEPYEAEAVINILAEAIADISANYSVCANDTVDISVVENGEGEWSVDPMTAGSFVNASDSATQFIPSVDYYTAQTFDITWVTFDPDGDGPCASAEDDTTVSILPLPQINMSESFSIPCGDDISATVSTYQNTTYTFVWSPTTGLIEPDQLITPVIQDNEYTLQVTDANQCTSTDTTLVDAIALSDMASAADASTCLYVPIELSGFGANGEDPFSYSWELTEEVSESVINDSLANFLFDDYILQDSVLEVVFFVTDVFGCTDEDTINVTVFALPAIDPGQNWNLCEDSPVFTLTNFSPQPNTGISGVWTPSDVVNPDLIGVDAVTYTYTFTDNNGCVNDSSMLVSINEVPQPMMVIPSVACVETPLPLENNSTCGTCSNVEYEWDFGIANSTSTEFEPSFIYSVNDIGLQTVQLVAISGFGCDDTTTALVDIVPPPVPLFEATYNQPSCAPLAVDISHNTDTTGLYVAYEWTIEDVTENNIVGVYTTFLPPTIVLQQGDSIVDYIISLMVSNVCGNYDTDTLVSVLPQPVADILTSTVYGCTPLEVDFINESVGLPDAIEWDFGDGTFSGMDTPPPHTFYTDSTITIYNLVVALENECGVDTFFQDITVLPNTVTALFTTSTASGCTPLEVTFTDFSTGASQLNFTLCNGVTNSSESFTYTFTEPGSCEVQLVADNGCSFDTTTVPIFVVQSPEPSIEADFSYCANEPIEFVAVNDDNAMLTWNFDDGSLPGSGNPIEHAYTDAGDYLVELHAENNLFGVQCEGSATLPVHISPNPQAEFSVASNYGCSPFEVCFNNLSGTTDPGMLLFYQWNFDGVNLDTAQNPCFTYFNQSGELVYYTINLEVTAADYEYMQTCSTITSQNILVLPQPISDFEMSEEYSCYFPYELTTTNTTQGGGAYQWQLNGENAGQFTNASFIINNLGAYDIGLMATNQFGCTDTSEQVFNSYPLPTLDFTFDLNDGCAPLTVQFENLSTGNNSYVWNMGDNTEANVQDIVHEYNYPGAYEVMLIGTSENNCVDTLTIEDPIRVYPVPVANFIFAPEEVNILDPQITFEETGFGGSYFHWDFNDGSEDYGAIVAHSFSEAYYHAVTLTAYNQYGCTDEITKNVFVTDYLTVYVPNAFTPDDDNINDIFRPEMGGKEMIVRYKFWITDRWGNVIFHTEDYDEPWTGNVRGGNHYVAPDSYQWNVEVELKNGEEREYNGNVVVVR